MTSLLLPPPDLLPTNSQRWGRWVNDSVQKVAREQATADNNATQRNATMNGTIARLRTQISELQQTNARLQGTQDTLLQTQQDLQETVDYQASLVTESVSVAGTYNTGDVPGDSVQRYSSGGLACRVSLRVPTGNLLVAYGVGQVTVSAGNGGFICYVRVTATTPSGYSSSLGNGTRVYVQNGDFMGVPVASERTFPDVPKNEVVTVTVEFGTWSTATSPTSNAQFIAPYIRGQVIPA